MEWLVSIDDLDHFAEQFWTLLNRARVFAFHGEMGAGKTTLISALCRYKGTEDVTGSPTFSIINQYVSRDGQIIYHMDLYRLKDEEEVMGAGVDDCINSDAICMVEWPEKAPYLFDEATVHVFIEVVSATQRKIRIGEDPLSHLN